jgi:hypothetical protein
VNSSLLTLLKVLTTHKSMGRQATMELDQEHEALQVQLAEAYTAAMAQKERELADLRAQLARVQGRPPALAVLEETAEVSPRHS